MAKRSRGKVTFNEGLPQMNLAYLYEGAAPLHVELKIDWTDVFDRTQTAAFRLIEDVSENGQRRFNRDNPPSRIGKLISFTEDATQYDHLR